MYRYPETAEQAFNAGSDARLAGEPLSENPLDLTVERGLWDMWRAGWRHVNQFWGTLALNRWPVKTLPDVREEKTVSRVIAGVLSREAPCRR